MLAKQRRELTSGRIKFPETGRLRIRVGLCYVPKELCQDTGTSDEGVMSMLAWTLNVGGTRDCDTGSGGMLGRREWLLQRFSFLAFQRSV